MVNYHPFFILSGDELEFFRSYNLSVIDIAGEFADSLFDTNFSLQDFLDL